LQNKSFQGKNAHFFFRSLLFYKPNLPVKTKSTITPLALLDQVYKSIGPKFSSLLFQKLPLCNKSENMKVIWYHRKQSGRPQTSNEYFFKKLLKINKLAFIHPENQGSKRVLAARYLRQLKLKKLRRFSGKVKVFFSTHEKFF